MTFFSNCTDGLCGSPDCGICGPLQGYTDYEEDKDWLEDEEDEEFLDEDLEEEEDEDSDEQSDDTADSV
jgi:hypothetical protein